MRAVAVIFLLGCGSKEPSAEDTAGEGHGGLQWSAPDAPGPYGVGSTTGDVVGRTGVELEIQVWYPTEETDEDLHKYGGFLTGAALDAPAAGCDSPRPVVAFSHGNQGMRYQSIFLTEYLGSHGFVVVAPDHTGNTTFDYAQSRIPELIFRRPSDIADTVDWLFSDALDEIDGLENCVDPDGGYAVIGHSFGGYTATAVGGARFDFTASVAWCESAGGWLCDAMAAWIEDNPEYATAELSDDRVWAAIPLAPAGYEVLGGGLFDATAPFLVLGGERDGSTPMQTQVEPIYSGLGSENKYLGELLEAGHMIFSDACTMAPTMTECSPPYLSQEEGHPQIQTVVMAFLQSVLGYPASEEYFPVDSDKWDWSGS